MLSSRTIRPPRPRSRRSATSRTPRSRRPRRQARARSSPSAGRLEPRQGPPRDRRRPNADAREDRRGHPGHRQRTCRVRSRAASRRIRFEPTSSRPAARSSKPSSIAIASIDDRLGFRCPRRHRPCRRPRRPCVARPPGRARARLAHVTGAEPRPLESGDDPAEAAPEADAGDSPPRRTDRPAQPGDLLLAAHEIAPDGRALDARQLARVLDEEGPRQ